ALQPRFERRTGTAPQRLFEHLRFRAAYDFLILRCDAGEASAELGAWWTRYADGDSNERQDLIAEAAAGGGPRSAASANKRRRRRRPAARAEGAAGSEGGDPNDGGGSSDGGGSNAGGGERAPARNPADPQGGPA
ncbi:MAG: polynucleotide adenylyltransferase PcnB, partial [Burkholderiaceae bacterium]|nr:polynucleotide adenylyltransferase PcnB [Burkholderiaceae bacterium]